MTESKIYLSNVLYVFTLSSCRVKNCLISSLWLIADARNISTLHLAQRWRRWWSKSSGVLGVYTRKDWVWIRTVLSPTPPIWVSVTSSTKMADIPSNVTYKQLHERFVSDLNGTSVFEIGKVASAAPIGIFLRSILYNILFAKQENLTGSLFCW